ncbi:DUF2569 family protein [Paraburkholderia hayleyella]|uniref:DUF2569 family protein n=1 Tax=Paraburkholderia hayleyella TaxID=2152889 RepID=UPI00129276D0|nr:DUF2569 family protein [Paraburkholderia hayleyella]
MISKPSSQLQDEPVQANTARSAAPDMEPTPKGLRGWLLLAVLGLVLLLAVTVAQLRDPIKLMLTWELYAVFFRPETADWYRVVLLLTGLGVALDLVVAMGLGWLLLLVYRRSRRFVRHVQIWLVSVVALQFLLYLAGTYLSDAIAVPIALPLGGLLRSAVLAALGVPYFSASQRVRHTFDQP